jgi:phytoene dehydrogenase-like protein
VSAGTDVVVIGAGHNGLVTAAYLAKAAEGDVLEAAERTAGSPDPRIRPGFRVSGRPSSHAFHPGVAKDLG